MLDRPNPWAEPFEEHVIRPWTEAEYMALETNLKIELIDGRLVVPLMTANAHQEIPFLLWKALKPSAAAARLRTSMKVGLRLGPERIVIPDLTVGRLAWRDTLPTAADAVLVAEVTAPGTDAIDRGLKMLLYAEAAIDYYLLIEPDFSERESLTMRLFRLDGDRYVEHAAAQNGETLIADDPFPIAIRTDDLIEP